MPGSPVRCSDNDCPALCRGIGKSEPLRAPFAGNGRLRPTSAGATGRWGCRRGAMSLIPLSLEVAAIREHCKALRLPTLAACCERVSEEAIRERHTHLHFLDALLEAELEERQVRAVARRLAEAHLPRVKTLEEFDFTKAASL